MTRSDTATLILALSVTACSAGGDTSGSKPSNSSGSGAGGQAGPGGGGAAGDFPLGSGGSLIAIPSETGGRSGAQADAGSGAPTLPVVIDQCSTGSGVDAAVAQSLLAGGGGAAPRILYPYDGTVFPRGLAGPLLMWDGVTADAVYVHVHSSGFDYKGCFAPTGPNQFQLPDGVWKEATDHTGGAADPFQLEITASSGGAVTSVARETFVVAKATLKGSIFYNSYATKLLSGGLFGAGGAVLRLVPGKSAEVFLGMSGCTGCHSVSADGSRLVTLNLFSLTGGATYALTPGIAPNPPALAGAAPETSFTALYPNGSFYVTNAHQGGVGPRAGGPGAVGAANSAVYDTATGAAIGGTGVPGTAMTPSFSSDGSLLAFTDYAIDAGRGIALMDFDGAARTASGYRQIYKTAAPNYAAWPFVLPDNHAAVFALGTAADFSGNGAGLGVGSLLGSSAAPPSDLFVVDVASGTSTLLAQAMGFRTAADAASNDTYLPFGIAEETHHNFYPTVSPVAAGGYFWLFFDSYRHYGNVGQARELWGAALDISPDGSYTVDPSHPAFFLAGQEWGTGNHRAFTALDPCKKDGDSCETGIDCCGGFCTGGICKAPPPPVMGPVCVATDDSCATGLPCCNAHDRCISGHCGTILR